MERINPDGLLKWPPLAHVVVAQPGRLAFIAGQGPVDQNYQVVGQNLREQTLFAFKNLRTALRATGAEPSDVLSTTVYIVGLNEAKSAEFAEALSGAVDGQPFPPHAITMLGVSALGSSEALVEISAIASVR